MTSFGGAAMSGAEFARRHASGQDNGHTSANGHAGAQLFVIRVAAGELHEVVEQAHDLLAAGSPCLFQYGGQLCRVTRIAKTLKHKDGITVPEGTIELDLVTKGWLQLELCRLATWERSIVHKNGHSEWVQCDPPMKVASGVLDDRGRWLVPVLTGITEIPILRRDGSVCATVGYDSITGLYFDPSGCAFPPIPDRPTREDALAALGRLEEPLRDFPFVDPCHKAAATAMILTAVVRRQLKFAPAFAVTAKEAGTGKGLLVHVMAIIATGRPSPITPFTEDEQEQRKRITASLLAGHPIINIDNVDAPVDSPSLAALLTSEVWSDRILGVSKDTHAPSNAMLVMTGNNIVIQGDMTRRVIPIDLDARCERPELRTFDRNPLLWVAENRPRLVADALTVLSAWRREGQPLPAEFQPLGSYEDWSRDIAGCLIWLDRPDPTAAMERVRANDPERKLLRRVFVNWYELFGEQEQTIGAVLQFIEQAEDERPAAVELREALLEAAPDARNEHARRVRLGLYMRSNAGRVITTNTEDGTPMVLRLAEGATFKRAARWSVQRV